MSDTSDASGRPLAGRTPPGGGLQPRNRGAALSSRAEPQPSNLADLLERILDKGIVIAGDISVSLVDVELLTIRIRLLVASVDKAKEMGIDWWENDPMLSSRARRPNELGAGDDNRDRSLGAGGDRDSNELVDENARLRQRIKELEELERRER